ncbi:hypothetical protein VY88_04075 [Azospirillum thiophilum]|uniref:Uncharacterized protein n=1 Tax=Azospirillum thiophilum TaxID=528244 RepID=A0AAC8VX59_9PROT|nr:hypothetical protein [Azospirillum thiophilum]ALG70967.1 hypothetical protein AL072_08625 [Azospirillum thiophilum]KJR65370.1 hypothetical protein VY88_04075 [Azospirillum thiophilum]
MAPDLVFKAQALDNQSADHYRVSGQDLEPDDAARRQEAASQLSGVTKAGQRTFDQGGVRLTVRGDRFVLLVPSVERDVAGRIAPILCHGELGAGDRVVLVARVTEGLDAFARYIGRSIDPAKADLVRRAIASAPSAPPPHRFGRVLWLGALAFALVVALTSFWSRRPDPTPASVSSSDSPRP